MPQALVLIAPTLFGVGGSIALVTTAGALTTAGVVASIGGSLLLSAASNARNSAPASVKPENITLNVKQSTGDRIQHVGDFQSGGTIIFFRTRGGKSYRVMAHGHGEIDAITGYIFGGKPVTLLANDFISDPQYEVDGVRLVEIKSKLGISNETNYLKVENVWSEYDSTHKLNGIVTTLTVAESADAENQRRVYPNGDTSLKIVGRGAKVYDPRTTSTAYSDNAALIMAFLITNKDGFNRPDIINQTYLAAAADDYDDTFALAAGGTEKRARLCGSYSLVEQPANVLRRMQAACRARVKLLPDASYGIISNKWVPPTVTLDRSQLIAIDEWDGGPEQKDIYTELPFRYVDPNLGFQSVTGDAWVDAAREAENGQIAIGPEQDYSFSPSHSQCRRMAQDQIEWDNPAITLFTRWKPSARVALFEDFINIDMEELPDVFWRVKSYSLDLNTGEVTLALASYVPPVWSNALEGTPQALPTPDVDGVVPAPTNVTAVGQGVLSSQDSYAAGIVAVWDPRPAVSLASKVQYCLTGTDEWEGWPIAAKTRRANISGLTDGAGYDLRVFYETSGDTRSDYVTFTNVKAKATTDLPLAPTLFNVSDQGGGEALITLKTSASGNLWRTRIRRDGVTIATFYDAPETSISFTDTAGAGTYEYTARSINVSGDANATDAGPLTRTIT